MSVVIDSQQTNKQTIGRNKWSFTLLMRVHFIF